MKMTFNIRNYFWPTTKSLFFNTEKKRNHFLTSAGGNNPLGNEGRLDFIDGLRGLTMILVVYWHVLVMGMNFSTYTALTLQLFRMPLFFFISGFFAFSFRLNKEKFHQRMSNRWHRQLLPTFFIFLAFILFEVAYASNADGIGEFLGGFFQSAAKNATSEFKSGYWFTFVLVEVFCMFAPLNYLLCRKGVSRSRQGLIFLGMAALCGLLQWGYQAYIVPQKDETVNGICALFSLTHLMRYQVFFYLGAAARAFDSHIWEILRHRIVGITVLLLTVVVFWITPRTHVPEGLFYLAASTGIIFSISLFFYLRQFFNGNGAIGRLMKFIGKNTLPIYLFHYFIIRIMKDMDLSALAAAVKSGAWIEIPLIGAISVAIILTVLGVDALLKIKPRIHKLIFAC